MTTTPGSAGGCQVHSDLPAVETGHSKPLNPRHLTPVRGSDKGNLSTDVLDGEFPFYFFITMEEAMEFMDLVADIPSPEECASRIYDCSGNKFEPELASELWLKILQHKWFLSETLGRDVGLKVACLDLIENTDSIRDELESAQKSQLLKALGAQMVDRSLWDTISESQPPKQIVNKRIVLPLTEPELARKHGVTPPRTLIFFGPPGTGKTHFARDRGRSSVVVRRSQSEQPYGRWGRPCGCQPEDLYGRGSGP